MSFVPLTCRSHYSPLGVNSCADLVRRARSLGYTSLGLCDDTTMGGYFEFDSACKAEGIRPIFGCRLHFEGFELGDGELFPLDFLIQTEQGYRNLARLLTRRHETQARETNLRKRVELRGRTTGLMVITPPDGELARLVQQRDRVKTERYLATAVDYFGTGLAVGVDRLPDAPAVGSMLMKLAGFMNLPSPVVPRFCFADPADAPAFIYLDNREGAPGRGWKPPPDTNELAALVSEDEVAGRYLSWDESLHQSGEIARRCIWRPGPNRRTIPTQDFERGFDANSYLFDLVIEGAARRYGQIGDELKKRINLEFEEIKTRDLAPYLLLYRQVITFLDERGISRGFGRGSTVASVLAYCLGITQIDPLRYRLAPHPLAGETESYPPVRIEIPSSALKEMLDWLRETFGEQHLVQVGRRQEMKRDQLIDALAEWSGMTPEETKLAHEIKSKSPGGGGAQKLRAASAEKRWRRWRDPAFAAHLAARLAPRPKPPSPFAGRWTLSAEPVDNVFPVVHTAEGERVTDIGELAIDQLGGPRLEFVPHYLLNLLDRARLAVAESNPEFSLSKIPLDDRTTFDLISRGDTIGIPPLEGITTKCLLRKEKPTSILQLLKVKTEAARARGPEKILELIDELPDVLISYQCAYFKANHPEAYYAGALSSVAETNEDVSVLARAARRAGIEILPPDINLSSANCTVHGGEIRLGLRMVRQLGEKAWEEIVSVRRGGSFNTLTELCEGVSPRTVNHRLLQNLISAGALDCFGRTRAQMSELVSKLQRRSPNARENEEDAAQHTLFDLSEIEEEAPAEIESSGSDAAEWDEETMLRREKDALGFNLLVDPLDRFPATLASMRPLAPHEVHQRMNGKVIRVAGLIDHVDDDGPLIDLPGGRLLDLEGTPILLDPAFVESATEVLERGRAVLVIGEVKTKENIMWVEARGLWALQELEEQSRRVTTIRLDLAEENKTTVRHLLSAIRPYRGSTRIEPVGYPHGRGLGMRLLARRRVFFCVPLYRELCRILSDPRVELLDEEGEALKLDSSLDDAA